MTTAIPIDQGARLLREQGQAKREQRTGTPRLQGNVRELGGPARLEARRLARVARREDEHAREERIAKLRRQMLKRYGPRPDGIKAMIQERSRVYAERRPRNSDGLPRTTPA